MFRETIFDRFMDVLAVVCYVIMIFLMMNFYFKNEADILNRLDKMEKKLEELLIIG